MQANREPAKNATKKRPLDYFHVNSVADAPGGNILHLRTQHERALPARARRAHRLAPRREEERLRPARRGQVRASSTTRACIRTGRSRSSTTARSRRSSRSRGRSSCSSTRPDQARDDRQDVRPSARFSSPFEGNLQLLADGGAFVGWGGVRKVTEFAPHGEGALRAEAALRRHLPRLPLPVDGHAGGKPASASTATGLCELERQHGRRAWEVLDGARRGSPQQGRDAPWAGLETTIHLEDAPAAVAVRALDKNGDELGASDTLTS